MPKQRLLFGTWPSPVRPSDMAGALRFNDVAWDGDTLVWWEGRGKTGILVAQSGADGPRDLTSDLSVRAGVGYGGGDFTVAQGQAYFVSGGRLYRQALAGGGAQPITPAFGDCASPTVSPDGRWLVFVHSYEGRDSLALVDTAGQHWPQKLVAHSDFVMQPCWHPDGDQIACITWNYPQMPWDGTTLHLLTLELAGDDLPRLRSDDLLLGDTETSIFQPEFSPDGRSLSYASDETGWWQLYLRDLDTGETRQLTDYPAEHAGPAWQQGLRSYAWGGDGLYYLRSEDVASSLWHDDLSGAPARCITALDDYTAMGQIAVSPAGEIALTGSAARIAPRVLRYRPGDDRPRVLRRATTETWRLESLAQTQSIQWTGHDGETVHGLYSPPTSADYEDSGPAPLIVLVHGGPTGQSSARFNTEAQFFASRGFAVLDVNYRGGSGYGRAYRNKLRGNWGIYDAEDAASGAQHLVDQGLVDAGKLIITGGSAGGFTVYQSLIEKPGFYKAAICRYGVADQFALVQETHKFEARYSDSLLGPLPDATEVYRARSPVFHAEKIVDSIAIYQGAEDRVVPQNQSDGIVAVLKARGIPHEYTIYEGEGHGFRQRTTLEHYYQSAYQFLLKYVIYA